MKDILLDGNGDLQITDGDIALTDSVRQAVRVRLLWFFGEWRFAPQYGIPYFEDILIKNPDIEKIKQIVRSEALTVDEVIDVKNITVTVDKQTRSALIIIDIVTAEETYREEVLINA